MIDVRFAFSANAAESTQSLAAILSALLNRVSPGATVNKVEPMVLSKDRFKALVSLKDISDQEFFETLSNVESDQITMVQPIVGGTLERATLIR